MKFNLSTLTQGTNLGWVIGACILGPLLLWGFNALFMGGNKEAGKYVQRYIQESDTLIVSLDCDFEQKTRSVNSFIPIHGEGGKIRYRTYTFYSNKYKKYMSIYTFVGINIYKHQGLFLADAESSIMRYCFISDGLYDEKLVSFRVNRKQWNDPTYGTKENPMPIFWMKALSDYHSDLYFLAIVSDKVNDKFVECYLKFLLPKKEFKRLYGNDLKKE